MNYCRAAGAIPEVVEQALLDDCVAVVARLVGGGEREGKIRAIGLTAAQQGRSLPHLLPARASELRQCRCALLALEVVRPPMQCVPA